MIGIRDRKWRFQRLWWLPKKLKNAINT